MLKSDAHLSVKAMATLWGVDRKTAYRRLVDLDQRHGGVVFRRGRRGVIYTTEAALRKCAPELVAVMVPPAVVAQLDDHEARISTLERRLRGVSGRVGAN